MVIRLCEMISPGVFSVFQNFDFLGRQGGVKGQKIAQTDKTFCLSNLIFQEPYMIFIYDTHVCIKG